MVCKNPGEEQAVMSAKIQHGDVELAISSSWLPSPVLPDTDISSVTRSGLCASSCSRALRPGDWRRAAAADTDGGPVQVPSCSIYSENTPNIDDVHSPASANLDGGATSGLASPLVPRALVSSSGRRRLSPAGYAFWDQKKGSPSSLISVSIGEASLRLDSPIGDFFPDPSPSGLSPVQIRCPVPPGSELSTPGSGGYDSPSVLFAIEPSSLMRSSMQNPLFVDRPPSPSDSDIIKELELSPHADRSPSSRVPRRTLESAWSSSSMSVERSISLNPSQHDHDDKAMSVHYTDTTPSTAISSSRQASSSQAELTPRRLIKNLSALAPGVAVSVDLAPAARTTSPLMRGIERSAQAADLQFPASSSPRCVPVPGVPGAAPCSVALPVRAVDEAGVAKSEYTWLPNFEYQLPKDGRKPVQQTDSANVASSADVCKDHQAAYLDTALPGRTLDQSPRKGHKILTYCEAERQTAVKGGLDKMLTDQRRTGDLMERHKGLVQRQCVEQKEARENQRLGGILLSIASWALLFVVVTLMVLGLRNSSKDLRSPPSRVTVTVGFNTGPVCLPHRYPVANSNVQTPLTLLTPLGKLHVVRALRLTSTRLRAPFCWSGLPNCHALDELCPTVQTTPFASTTVRQSSLDVLDAGESRALCNSSEFAVVTLARTEPTEWPSTEYTGPSYGAIPLGTQLDFNPGITANMSAVIWEALNYNIGIGRAVPESSSDAGLEVEVEVFSTPSLAIHDAFTQAAAFDMVTPYLDVGYLALCGHDAGPPVDRKPYSTNVTIAADPRPDRPESSPELTEEAGCALVNTLAEATSGQISTSSVVEWLGQGAEYLISPDGASPEHEVAAAVYSDNMADGLATDALSTRMSNADVPSDQGFPNDTTHSAGFLATRLRGPYVLLHAAIICLVLALAVHLSRSMVRPHGVQDSVLQTTAQPVQVGRILRPKWSPGVVREEQAVQGLGPVQATELEARVGGFVWTGNKLVYHEG